MPDHPRPANSSQPTDPVESAPVDDTVLTDPTGGAAPGVPDEVPLLPGDGSDDEAARDTRAYAPGDPASDVAESAEPPMTVGGMTVPPPEEPTVGTGSFIAIGCGAGTLVFVIFVIVIAFWLR